MANLTHDNSKFFIDNFFYKNIRNKQYSTSLNVLQDEINEEEEKRKENIQFLVKTTIDKNKIQKK